MVCGATTSSSTSNFLLPSWEVEVGNNTAAASSKKNDDQPQIMQFHDSVCVAKFNTNSNMKVIPKRHCTDTSTINRYSYVS